MKYKVRHKPSGKFLHHEVHGHSRTCILVPSPYHPHLQPSEWAERSEAVKALVTTPFGIKNMELVEPRPEFTAASESTRIDEGDDDRTNISGDEP